MKTRAPLIWAGMLVFGLTGLARAQITSSRRELMQQFQQAFIDLSAQVRPSVVEISAQGPITDEERAQMNDLFKFFDQQQQGGEGEGEGEGDGGGKEEAPKGNPHGDPRSLPERGPRATASGFIFDTEGHIVTNNHVVRGADMIEVQLWDGTELPAKVIGTDPDADLAVIQIDVKGLQLTPVHLAEEEIQVGQFAIAMGSPNGLTGSFSYGHVTGLGRDSLDLPDQGLRFQEFIQTDAAINLGNSGGPLCDIDGQVIGVNVAIVYRANSIGFAIPVSRVRDVVPQLIASGKVIRGWLGVGVDDLINAAARENIELQQFIDANKLPDRYGSYITKLTPEGPAETGKLLVDDVIREINGTKIKKSTDLINTVSALSPGANAHITLWRRGESVELDIPVREYPGRTAALYGRDYLGMHVDTPLDLNPDFMKERGIKKTPSDFYIVEVVPNSPAAEAGIRRGDVVVEVGFDGVKNLAEFKHAIKQKAKPGEILLMKVWTLTEDEPRKVYVKIPDGFKFD